MEKPSGKIIKIVGQKNQKGIEELMVLYSNGINLNFSDNVKNEAGKLKFNIDKNIRKDLKNEFIITIDGEDAKDLDDAIGVKKLPNGNYELGVHIADVSHYVKEGGFLDKEALLRGTSIYLPDRVIPMLPNELSNNLCSLNPNEPKFTLSAILEIGKDGKIIKRKVEETLIKSKARMTYNEVAEILKGKECSKQLKEIITNSYDLYKIIYKRRKIEGKVEFDFGETKIKIGKNGEVVDVFKIQRNDAHKIIEEFMIIANEEVSKIFSELKIPFLYRTHEKPSLADMEKLKDILLPYSIKLNTNNVSSLEISHIIDSLKGKPYEYSVSKQILKAMAKAKYLPFAIGHFGLSLKYYSHFTSPIRRYPDLQIHRIIKKYLHGNLPKYKIKLYTSQLGRISKKCSKNEEKAEEIENK
ncbi:VacB/RNase II family 3'-5' exoribonuclease, partial [Candidatus Gracilibacteria bacterium]|nr:VacB/RNase II family 3'-5' exoribonuclease [Candidatus Gracilibacteria bacterium]